jgi:hypothetical protein
MKTDVWKMEGFMKSREGRAPPPWGEMEAHDSMTLGANFLLGFSLFHSIVQVRGSAGELSGLCTAISKLCDL